MDSDAVAGVDSVVPESGINGGRILIGLFSALVELGSKHVGCFTSGYKNIKISKDKSVRDFVSLYLDLSGLGYVQTAMEPLKKVWQ